MNGLNFALNYQGELTPDFLEDLHDQTIIHTKDKKGEFFLKGYMPEGMATQFGCSPTKKGLIELEDKLKNHPVFSRHFHIRDGRSLPRYRLKVSDNKKCSHFFMNQSDGEDSLRKDALILINDYQKKIQTATNEDSKLITIVELIQNLE